MIEWRIIAKKIAGIANNSEEWAFDKWLNESDLHVAYYEKAVSEFKNPSEVKISDEEMEELIGEFDRFILKESQRKIKRRRYVVRAAAVLFIPIAVAAAFMVGIKKTVSDENRIVQVASPVSVKPGVSKASIILDNGEVLVLDGIGDRQYVHEGSDIVMTQKKGTVSYSHSGKEGGILKETFNTIAIPAGGEYILELSDGSKVWLNSKTSLTYPVRFLGDERVVVLDGEAYFDISHDARKPFIVKTAGSQVKVYGTVFNICSYSDEVAQHVTLCKGSVSVACSDREVFLKPGEQARITDGGRVTVKEVNTDLYATWHLGYFLFENETLCNIMAKLSRWYGIPVEFCEESLKSLHFTGDLRRYDNFEVILSLIEMTCDVKFEIRGSILKVERK